MRMIVRMIIRMIIKVRMRMIIIMEMRIRIIKKFLWAAENDEPGKKSLNNYIVISRSKFRRVYGSCFTVP